MGGQYSQHWPVFIGMVQDWIADPWVRGSYSYPTLNTYADAGSSERMALAAPVDDKLFFAGEGTSHRNPACVPGALQEGERAAEQIHRLLEGVSAPPVDSDTGS